MIIIEPNYLDPMAERDSRLDFLIPAPPLLIAITSFLPPISVKVSAIPLRTIIISILPARALAAPCDLEKRKGILPKRPRKDATNMVSKYLNGILTLETH